MLFNSYKKPTLSCKLVICGRVPPVLDYEIYLTLPTVLSSCNMAQIMHLSFNVISIKSSLI